MKLALALAAGLAFLLAAATAVADLRYRVVVLRPAVTDDVTSDALARVRGELTAAGFEVSELPPAAALEVRTALETVGRELDPIAAFAIVRAPAGNTAEIWVCDRMAGKSVIQSVRLDAPGAPGEPSRSVVLAVQAVELLKASLAQYWLASQRRASPPPSGDGGAGPGAPPAAYVTAGPGVAAAVGLLDSVGTVGPVWQPIVRVSYGGAGGWAGRISVGGLGTEAELRAPAGSAQIRQTFGVVEILRGFRAGKRVQPVAAIGAGVYRARVAGVGAANYQGVVQESWSALAVAGVGAVVPLVARVALTADAQIALAFPDTVVRLDYAEAGRIGRPSLLLSAGVLATF
jgi:hypothetical protein